ncbi:peptidoglycan DD-metalloendopeptidase family protein [Glaciecola sp. MH2013]|uniref:peptidoglycan DD-metalloendopeptidase family protein n=1 Tax=Glaciecola sp. MH2013 TaxID=2785524 RepID=UPI00189E5AF1|nr:peptidoglycan DD-metalloendopeptidase family protein [Glaciecola sp. MH2013]MBF7074938.1 peptidoglycan DD-metalloendopeptidase family protein [Glaciecola sp. MH2013]
MITNTIKQLPKPHRLTLACVAAILVVLALFPSDSVKASRNLEVKQLVPGVKYDITLPQLRSSDVPKSLHDETENWTTHKVSSGDTLARIFSNLGLSPTDTHNVSSAGKLAKNLTKIKPGDLLYIQIDENKQFQSLRYPLSKTETLSIKKNANDKLESDILVQQVETVLNFAQGEIKSSFWNAGIDSGLTYNQIMRLAGIFGWDIDFGQEIRQGDTFNVIFEEQYIDGEFVGFGDIVAAEFINQGDVFQAIKYEDGNFYTPDGRSMRKSFLRAPVSFKYISSSFKKRRFHPVQKRWKAHRGVDYAAKVGTPVMAAGDGKVIKAAYDRYNGHHVFIQHGEKYTTKYLHFSKRAVKKGDTVKQGQTIGYLGATGMVTGPHLHYEFLVNGVHRNPRTVKLPQAEPIAKSEAAKFAIIADKKVAMLDNNKRIMLAMHVAE